MKSEEGCDCCYNCRHTAMVNGKRLEQSSRQPESSSGGTGLHSLCPLPLPPPLGQKVCHSKQSDATCLSSALLLNRFLLSPSESPSQVPDCDL